MPLTKEQLLIPRYKVIADYPQPSYSDNNTDHKFVEGDLLIQCNVNGAITFKRQGRLGFMSVGVPCCAHPEKYPKIFQPLPWWSDRKPEDMPMFIKEVDSLYKIGEVVKVKEWVLENEESDCPCFQDEKDNHYTWIRGFEPATEAEYTAYINQKQQ